MAASVPCKPTGVTSLTDLPVETLHHCLRYLSFSDALRSLSVCRAFFGLLFRHYKTFRQPSNVLFRALSTMSQLEELRHDDIKGQAAAFFFAGVAALPNLRVVDLSGADEVTDEQVKRMFGFPRPALQWLSLERTSVTEASLPVLASLTGLRFLDISNSNFESADWSQLKPLTNLKFLLACEIGLEWSQVKPILTEVLPNLTALSSDCEELEDLKDFISEDEPGQFAEAARKLNVKLLEKAWVRRDLDQKHMSFLTVVANAPFTSERFLEFLVGEAGCDPQGLDLIDEPPIMPVASHGSVSKTQILLDAGARTQTREQSILISFGMSEEEDEDAVLWALGVCLRDVAPAHEVKATEWFEKSLAHLKTVYKVDKFLMGLVAVAVGEALLKYEFEPRSVHQVQTPENDWDRLLKFLEYTFKEQTDMLDLELEWQDRWAELLVSTNQANKVCSYSHYGKTFIGQHVFECNTCGFCDAYGICAPCAAICHKGHDLTYTGCAKLYCDCGNNTIDDHTCRALVH